MLRLNLKQGESQANGDITRTADGEEKKRGSPGCGKNMSGANDRVFHPVTGQKNTPVSLHIRHRNARKSRRMLGDSKQKTLPESR